MSRINRVPAPTMQPGLSGGATANKPTLGQTNIIALNNAKVQDIGWVHIGAGAFATTFWLPILDELKRKGHYDEMGVLVQPNHDDFVAQVHQGNGIYSYDVLPPHGSPYQENVNCLGGTFSLNESSSVGLKPDSFIGNRGELHSLGRKLVRTPCISLGVTEGAYKKDSQVLRELKSFLGGLYSLYTQGGHNFDRSGKSPIHVFSLDNLESVDVLKKILIDLANRDDELFATWLQNENDVIFHEVMVDAAAVHDENNPLRRQREPFPQVALVIYDPYKDDPKRAIPIPFEKLGRNIIVTSDHKVFEAHKNRKLLGLLSVHSSLVPLGILHGYRRVKDAMQDQVIEEFVHKIAFQCAVPTLETHYMLDGFSANDLLSEWVNVRLPNQNLPHHNLAIFRDQALKMNWRISPLINLVKNDGNALRYLTASVVCGLNTLTPISKARDLPDGKVVYKGKIQEEVSFTGRFESPPNSGLFIDTSDMTYEFTGDAGLAALIGLRGSRNESTVRDVLLGNEGVLRKILGDELANNGKITTPIINGYIQTVGEGKTALEYIRTVLN